MTCPSLDQQQLARPHALQPSEPVAGHIPGRDGLRASAVLAVLAYHVWPNHLPHARGQRGTEVVASR